MAGVPGGADLIERQQPLRITALIEDGVGDDRVCQIEPSHEAAFEADAGQVHARQVASAQIDTIERHAKQLMAAKVGR